MNLAVLIILKKSYESFTLSAKRGNAQAYAHLGLMYLFGKYVE